MKLTVGSLFSGIGGIDLGLERAGMETRWFSEIDPYASRVLAKHWPGVPNLGDITKIDFRQVEKVDVLCGGFPCQDISNAGKREGIDGERSGLWSEYARSIREIGPRYVLVENVAALLVRGIGRVLGDLAALGYDAEWDCIPASSVGAPHGRDRLWLIAYPQRSERGEEQHDGSLRRVGRVQQPLPWDRSWEVALRDFRRVDDGSTYRVDRVDTIRNAVVPQIPEMIGGWIVEHARRAA